MNQVIDKQYQWRLTLLLSLTFGVVFFDRNAANFLTPFIAADLHLSFTQVGLISSGLALTWAIAGMFGGVISDRTGSRKVPLLICIVAFSFCSVLSGMAATFATLLAARLLMGIAEGPILPISQSLVAEQSSREDRGHNMGVTQTAGSALLGSFLAPIILVPIAQKFGWSGAMYLAALPGLLMAALVWKFVREPTRQPREVAGHANEHTGLLKVLAFRNVILSVIGSVFIVAFIIIGWVFMPQYYTQLLGFSPVTMSRMMSLLGLSNAFSAFLIPRLSDRIGRKPVIIATCVIGLLIPFSLLSWSGSALLLAPLIFVGALVGGASSLFMGVVPSETVPPRMVATAVALVVGLGEILGGVAGPTLSGIAADHWGLRAPMWITVGCLVVAIGAASAMQETAPRALARRSALGAPAGLTPP
jgi:ACS family hexuronate transporter-like MFS transporter